MSENTETTTTPQEPAELQGDGGIPSGHVEDNPKKALIDVLWRAVKEPEVKEWLLQFACHKAIGRSVIAHAKKTPNLSPMQ